MKLSTQGTFQLWTRCNTPNVRRGGFAGELITHSPFKQTVAPSPRYTL